jgi:dethiobiotin synthetase
MKRTGVFITGTDTGVGKTVIAAGLTGILRQAGVKASYFKPVQSGGIKRHGKVLSPDLTFVQAVVGLEEDDLLLNPVCLEPPLAPSVAAEVSGRPIDLNHILEVYRRLGDSYDFLVVEGAGGLYVPLIGTEFLIADLIKLLELPVIIVARAGLGTINHTALTVKAAEAFDLQVQGVIINFSSKPKNTLAEKSNPAIIERLTGKPILGIIPYIHGLDELNGDPSHLVETVGKSIDIERFLARGVNGL